MPTASVRKDYLHHKPTTTEVSGTVSTGEPNYSLPARKPPMSQGRFGIQQTASDPNQHDKNSLQPSQSDERLLNARQVADKLGVSERWVRDHTTRRSPKIRAIKLGPLVRYRRADVEVFMASLDTFTSSRQPRFGV
jgi:predicted DNA-binding transcriptional regulator AlpA